MAESVQKLQYGALVALLSVGLAWATAAPAGRAPASPRAFRKVSGSRTGGADVPAALRRAINRTVGQSWSQQTQIDNPGGGIAGAAVALSADGTVALIPAGGVAYVFVEGIGNAWYQSAELTPSDSSGGFGDSVALSADGTTAIVGAPDGTVGDSYRGSAYVFNDNSGAWSQSAELSASDGMQSDIFGFSVALSSDGTTAFISAPGHGNYSGAAYVFNDNAGTWTQTDEFTTAGQALLGESVALSADGTIAIAGAPDANTGTVYVYTNNAGTWSQSAALSASDGVQGDAFGGSVALSSYGTTVLVGADYTTVNGNTDQGAAYVFTEIDGTWRQRAELTALDGQSLDLFGSAVALSSNGNAALVGAHGHLTYRGAAYVFTASGSQWTQTAELTASDGSQYDEFGTSIGLSGDGATALIGAPGYYGVGDAYVFTGPLAQADAFFKPSSGPPGSTTHVLASGFSPGETVDLSIGGLSDHIQADADGQFGIALRVPNVPPNTYTLTATGETSGLTAQATFTVTASGPRTFPSGPSDWILGGR